MPSIQQYNACGEELEKILHPQTSPIAVKMLKKETDIPEGAFRPKKDCGYHLAQCQAFAMSRRESATVAMLKEDNWCPGAIISYGMVKREESPGIRRSSTGDRFPLGKYIGILTAPLKTAIFKPDVVIMYSDTNQLRNLLLAMKEEERSAVTGYFFPFSCGHSVVTPILNRQYAVVLPDPGEYARALTLAREMMFSIPADRLEGLVSDLKEYQVNNSRLLLENMIMRPDFPQPDLYKKVFEAWGMDHEK